MSYCISDRVVYLTGRQIKELADLGVTQALYSVSDMEQYAGHVTAVYFLTANWVEQAHLTGISKAPVFYSRTWGSCAGYQGGKEFTYLLGRLEELRDNIIYRII